MKLPSRRSMLQSAGGLAVPAKALPGPAGTLLPTVTLGKRAITRLILGSNPFNGFSYSLPTLDRYMREWSTPENICAVLRAAEQNGINTWQFSYYPNSMAAIEKHRAEGGRLNWILLGGGEMKDNLPLIGQVARLGPLAIVHHGGVTDQRFADGQREKVRDFLKAVRSAGVMVGLSTHQPGIVEYVEEHDWDLDFYMTCFHQLSRPAGELRKMLGEMPLGPVFLEGDPARMCRVIRQTRRTCLAFKILGAGRLARSARELEAAFRFAFENIKPQDAVIVGMFPRFQDEVRQNADLVRRICNQG